MGIGPLVTDAYGHLQGMSGPTTLTAALTGTTVAGTIAVAAAGAGAGSAVTISAAQTPNDVRGQFGITGAGAPAAGLVARVNFAQPYAAIPAVTVNLANATPAGISASAVNVSVNGFDIYAGAAITVGANICSYVVIA